MRRLVWAVVISIVLHGLAFLWIQETPRHTERFTELVEVDLTLAKDLPLLNSSPATKQRKESGEAKAPDPVERRVRKEQTLPEENSLSKTAGDSPSKIIPINDTVSAQSLTGTSMEKEPGKIGEKDVESPGGSDKASHGVAEAGAKLQDHHPILVAKVEPDYPAEARFFEGRVVLDFLVGLDGYVSDIRILKTSGYKAMDKAAVKAAEQYRYQPAIRDGKPAAERIRRTIHFKLT